ncbi:alpha/beta hydrolase [Rhodophyticola sp. CCM32]|uniref:alpha/beta fold hydrolase n=1 Tax=Rhodophyticola sp. CCM32 TaxID=2916397 RepID=UPI00107F2CC1|nr:alpha/beta hydrolase [Rhodophyticola sp. CCM32]QBX99858.1 alpha/beta hydrolase [Rhodophyticola sp. CCM32]
MIRHVTARDGLQLAYADQGTGVPLLCLPGLTRNMEDFEPVLEAFSDRARIITMDFRGRGASDYAPDPGSYTVPQEAQDVLSLLDHLGLDKVSILGTSRGGLVAMMLAATAKDRLSGVILNDVGPVIDTAGLDLIMEYIGRPPAYGSLAEAAAALPGANAPDFRNVPAETWAAMARRLWREEGGRLHLRYDPRLREAVAPAFDTSKPAPDLWPLFDALEGLPLGLIRAANSNLLSGDSTAEMRRRRPDMLFAEIPDRGHVPFLDEPGAVVLIFEFLDQVS